MKKALLTLGLILMTACGRHTPSDGRTGGGSNPPKRILTEFEKTKLATTSVYYIEQFTDTDVNQCDESLKVNLINQNGQLIVRACKKIYTSCLMEGTCLVSIKNKMQMLGVDGRLFGVRRFRNITGHTCQFGCGASKDLKTTYKNVCVDPFYSVAADLKIYNLGDVIYLPAVRGTKLPNGEVHEGYFIVRDNGGGINGRGRFDFFTGFFTTKSSNNPFIQLRLNDLETFPEYYLIDGSDAENIRKKRNFPLLQTKT